MNACHRRTMLRKPREREGVVSPSLSLSASLSLVRKGERDIYSERGELGIDRVQIQIYIRKDNPILPAASSFISLITIGIRISIYIYSPHHRVNPSRKSISFLAVAILLVFFSLLFFMGFFMNAI